MDNPNTKQIKVLILHTFDTRDKSGNFAGKKWKPNALPYDKKVLVYNITSTDTIDTLKNNITDKTRHNKFAIKIYSEKNDIEINDGFDNSLSNSKKLHEVDTKLFYAILEEMSSNGYC